MARRHDPYRGTVRPGDHLAVLDRWLVKRRSLYSLRAEGALLINRDHLLDLQGELQHLQSRLQVDVGAFALRELLKRVTAIQLELLVMQIRDATGRDRLLP